MRQLTGSVTELLPASARDLWDLVTDVERMGEWSPECTGATWEGTVRAAVPGAAFRGWNALGPFRWSTTCEIEESVRPTSFRFVARHWTGAATRWTFRFKESDNRTLATEAFETVGTPPLMLAIDRIARRERVLARGMRTTLRSLDRVASMRTN